MSIIFWSNEYSSKIDEVDNQHKVLIQIIDDLYIAIKKGEQRAIQNDLLFRLINYIHYHFDYEEILMEQYKYSELDRHKIEHQNLTIRVLDYYKDVKTHNSDISTELLIFLKDWLNNHILLTDKKMGYWITDNIQILNKNTTIL
ncbi:MAG TPA: bacteriohemerythrin [Bacteroidota bacterium]|nr:bacteriohemerythrin [Bacteroidota bacterium]HRT67292.1 bacteriohemerythrin [Bacteroidota bacterium]